MLGVGVAAPVTMLLLAASDQLSAVVSSAAGEASTHFLTRAALLIGGLAALARSPFLAFLIGVFTVAGAIVLWIELLMREAAVYVIVMMLPLAFAAMVWPARRIWAIRAVEVLIALILSKFAIVAVLSLGGAALSASVGAGAHGIPAAFAGVVLLVLGAFAPWALLRLLPLAEIAASAAGSLRSEMRNAAGSSLEWADAGASAGDDWALSTTAHMRRDALDSDPRRDQGSASEGAWRPPTRRSASEPTSRPPALDTQSEGIAEGSARGGREVAFRVEPEEDGSDRSDAGGEGAEARAETPKPDIPVLQDMAKPGNEGKWALDLDDIGTPPPDVEPQ